MLFQAVKYTVTACFFGIQWDLHHLEELSENGGGSGILELVAEVKRRLGELMVLLAQMLEHSNVIFNEEVNELTDIWFCKIVFGFNANIIRSA